MACGEVCPKGCINFNMGNDGFWYPHIEQEVCIGCHACQRACPVIKPKNHAEKQLPKAYAAWTEEKARHNSTSGGAFYAMAVGMIQNGGYVSGAVFDGARVKHIVTCNIEDLQRIQGTKYFQSDTTGVFKEIPFSVYLFPAFGWPAVIGMIPGVTTLKPSINIGVRSSEVFFDTWFAIPNSVCINIETIWSISVCKHNAIFIKVEIVCAATPRQ